MMYIILKYNNFWYDVSYIVPLDTIYFNLPTKNVTLHTYFGVLSKIFSIPGADLFPKRPPGHRLILCPKLYDFAVSFVTLPII